TGVTADGNDVWLVGYAPGSGTSQPMVQHCNAAGTQCILVPAANAPSSSGFSAISAIWPNDLWAIGNSADGTLTERYNDPCATATGTYVPPTRTSTATSVISPTNTRTPTPTATPTQCIAGWAYGPNLPVASA